MKKVNLILQVLQVGIVGKNKILSKDKIKNNDLILAIPSSGLHSNGYSLVRYLLKQKKNRY
jgi:phosphoribosylaminoimidazole (AIR) synthetase